MSASSRTAEKKAEIVIQNLVDYDVLVGMTESMYESMQILRHVLLSPSSSQNETEEEGGGNNHRIIARREVEEVFNRFTPAAATLAINYGNSTTDAAVGDIDGGDNERNNTSNVKGGINRNTSANGQLSTSSVMRELRKDEGFMRDFDEYVKYEAHITDFAREMHRLQYDWCCGRGGSR